MVQHNYILQLLILILFGMLTSHLHSGHAAFVQPNLDAIQQSVRKGTSSGHEFSHTAIKQTPNFQCCSGKFSIILRSYHNIFVLLSCLQYASSQVKGRTSPNLIPEPLVWSLTSNQRNNGLWRQNRVF